MADRQRYSLASRERCEVTRTQARRTNETEEKGKKRQADHLGAGVVKIETEGEANARRSAMRERERV